MKSKHVKKILKKLVILTMCATIVIPAVHTTPCISNKVEAAAVNDYTQWKQTDSAWNQSAAWPKSAYPNATYYYFKDCGCVVTSLAMLLRHHGVVTTSDVNKFNPWICNQALKKAGAFNSYADLMWANVSKAYPDMVYKGTKAYSLNNLKSLINAGYACMVSVNNGGHYVAIKSLNGNTVNIMDPGSSTRTTLAQCNAPKEIVCFAVKSNQSATSTSNKKEFASITGANKPNTLLTGKPYSIKGVISAKTNLKTVKVGVYDKTGKMKTGKTYSNVNKKTFDLKIADPYVFFNKLPNGSYTYRVEASTSSGNKVLISHSFKVTSVKISGYNAPTSIKRKQCYSIKGKIESASKLTSVTVGVYNSKGKAITSKTVKPNSKVYDLKAIDKYIRFDHITSKGDYYYRIKCTNSKGTVTLLNHKFYVK